MTLAELLRAADHDGWWQDGVQVLCEHGGELRPVSGIRGGTDSEGGKDVVVLTTSEDHL